MTPAPKVLSLAVVAIGAAARVAAGANRHATVAVRLPSDESGGAGAVGAGRLRPSPPPAWLEAALVNAGIDVPAATVWLGWLAAFVTVTLGALVISGAAAAVLAALVVGGVPPVALRSQAGRADRQLEKELPQALEAIARSLRSGASVRQAIGEAAASGGFGRRRRTTGTGGGSGRSGSGGGGPGVGSDGLLWGGPGSGRGGGRLRGTEGRGLQGELAMVANQAGHGAGLVEALEALALRRPSPGVRLAVAALCLGLDTGGAQARAVDGVAATMRERLGVEAEVRALASQARMSAVVIGLAPLGFGAFAAATDPRTSEFLLHTSVGLALVCVGLLLDGAGWLWMQRLCQVRA